MCRIALPPSRNAHQDVPRKNVHIAATEENVPQDVPQGVPQGVAQDVAQENEHIATTEENREKMSPANVAQDVALQKKNDALQNEHISSTEKTGHENDALANPNDALQNNPRNNENLKDFIKAEIKKDNTITRKEIATKAKVSKKTIERLLKDIPEIKYVGVGRHGHWELDE